MIQDQLLFTGAGLSKDHSHRCKGGFVLDFESSSEDHTAILLSEDHIASLWCLRVHMTERDPNSLTTLHTYIIHVCIKNELSTCGESGLLSHAVSGW